MRANVGLYVSWVYYIMPLVIMQDAHTPPWRILAWQRSSIWTLRLVDRNIAMRSHSSYGLTIAEFKEGS
jgi:hypothetical protein